MQRAVVHVRDLPGPAGHNEDVGLGDVGERGVGDQAEGADFVVVDTGPLGDEHRLGTRQPAEGLVRADGVQGGEAVEEEDGDLHGLAPWGWVGVGGPVVVRVGQTAGTGAGWKRRRYSAGAAPRTRMKARRMASGVP